MRACSTCKANKPITDFSPNPRSKSGLQGRCKVCVNAYYAAYRSKNKIKISESNAEYARRNKDRIKMKHAEYYVQNRGHILQRSKNYRDSNTDKEKTRCRIYRENNPHVYGAWRKDNQENLRQYQRQYRCVNAGRLRIRQQDDQKRRCQVDPLFKLRRNLANAIYCAFRSVGAKKPRKTSQLLGIDAASFRRHLIDTAIRNYGYYDVNKSYHIDHVVPNSSATTEDELIKLQHYTNFQLLYPEHNLAKSDKLDWVLPSTGA